MGGATRLGDYNSGHDSCKPVPLEECSSDVLINGKGAGRQGDKYLQHGCSDHPMHEDYITSGSSSVYINGKQAASIGDPLNKSGSFVVEGSDNVFIGG